MHDGHGCENASESGYETWCEMENDGNDDEEMPNVSWNENEYANDDDAEKKYVC